MIYIIVISVLIFIGSGFAVKVNPDLIAGYNTLNNEKKKKVDIKGLSTHLRNSFIVTGSLIIVVSISFQLLGLYTIAGIFLPIIILGGLVFSVAKARKYNL